VTIKLIFEDGYINDDGDSYFIYRTILVSKNIASYEIEWQFILDTEDNSYTADYEAIRVFGNYGNY
jgi:hypothetical protein